MARQPTNIARSVKDRLLNLARAEGKVFDVVLVCFALERLLYRLSLSEYRDRFVLKGGMLVTVWLEDDNRVTRDADFLGHVEPDTDRLVADFREIMSIPAEDGLIFDVEALAATTIREAMEYGGIRIKTNAFLETTRIPITIDIGFGDALAETTRRLDYPTLLDLPSPEVRVYPPASVIAEKFQAIVALGLANGRMKDFYDLWAIPTSLDIPDEELDAAIVATFERRGTEIPIGQPTGLSQDMIENPDKQRQWNAYAASIELEQVGLDAVVEEIWTFVGPACARIQARRRNAPSIP